MNSLPKRCFYIVGEEFHELDIGNHENKWKNNTHDDSVPDYHLIETLYKDENDIIEMNDEDRWFDVMYGIVFPLKLGAYRERSSWEMKPKEI